jgi:hypothetical protein
MTSRAATKGYRICLPERIEIQFKGRKVPSQYTPHSSPEKWPKTYHRSYPHKDSEMSTLRKPTKQMPLGGFVVPARGQAMTRIPTKPTKDGGRSPTTNPNWTCILMPSGIFGAKRTTSHYLSRMTPPFSTAAYQ